MCGELYRGWDMRQSFRKAGSCNILITISIWTPINSPSLFNSDVSRRCTVLTGRISIERCDRTWNRIFTKYRRSVWHAATYLLQDRGGGKYFEAEGLADRQFWRNGCVCNIWCVAPAAPPAHPAKRLEHSRYVILRYCHHNRSAITECIQGKTKIRILVTKEVKDDIYNAWINEMSQL